MPNTEPLNIRLTGQEWEPAGPEWARASEADRRAYWRRLGEIALEVKRREIRRGIGIDGKKLKPVKPESRPDGAKGPPLIPHYAESRTINLLDVRTTASAATLYWKGHGRTSWAKILGYHAYKHGARALPVRNTIGISPAGRKKIARDARDWWKRTHVTPKPKPEPRPKVLPSATKPVPQRATSAGPQPLPPGARPGPGGGYVIGKVHYLAPGQKPNPLSKYIEVYDTSQRSQKGTPTTAPVPPKPKPGPRPKASPPAKVPARSIARTPAPVQQPAKAPPPAPGPVPSPGATPAIQRAIAAAQALGVPIAPNGHAAIATWTRQPVNRVIAAFRPKDGTLYINEKHPYWSDPATYMANAGGKGWFSSTAEDHIIHHELAHAQHDAVVVKSLRGSQFKPAQQARIATEVSRYAATHPLEFVAEVYAGLKAGKTYNTWVMAFYAKLKGPTP
jgi:hypothetical protein